MLMPNKAYTYQTKCRATLGVAEGDADEDICVWTEDDEGNWDTSCDQKHTFFDGGPADNRHVWCPYCAGRIEAKHYEEEVVDDEGDA